MFCFTFAKVLLYYDITKYFRKKSYQKVLVLTFIYINKVIFYRFSQYISNTQILSKYYFILRAIIIYIIYLIIYRENKRCASWVVDDADSRAGVPSIVGGAPPGWSRWHIPADPDRRSQPEPPSVAGQSSS